MISTEHRGLASARNTGYEAADGEIVAYIDDDARPDPHWLTYLATSFIGTAHAGVGGPNIPPEDEGAVADCVANAPGGPVHVLLSDTEAEHIPGCNMAFRKSALEAIEGFDRQFGAAGDDVDVCWRLQERGLSLGFNPAAVVWHRRRSSVGAYWRQQRGYGRAEAQLERKWPEKYNSAGHLSWHGRLYGLGIPKVLAPRRRRVYHGTWGTRLFQSVYEPAQASLRALPLMPEWYLLICALAALSALGAVWSPLLLALPALAVAISLLVLQAVHGAHRASFGNRRGRRRRRGLTALLYVLQPLARLRGRLGAGLTPWRRPATRTPALPFPRTDARWSEEWQSQEEWLVAIEVSLLVDGVPVRRGGDFDRWDLEARGGPLGRVRVRMALEEHGAGRQLARFGLRPVVSRAGAGVIALFGFLAVASSLSGAVLAPLVLVTVMAALAARTLYEWSLAMGSAVRAVHGRPEEERTVLVRALEEAGQEA